MIFESSSNSSHSLILWKWIWRELCFWANFQLCIPSRDGGKHSIITVRWPMRITSVLLFTYILLLLCWVHFLLVLWFKGILYNIEFRELNLLLKCKATTLNLPLFCSKATRQNSEQLPCLKFSSKFSLYDVPGVWHCELQSQKEIKL